MSPSLRSLLFIEQEPTILRRTTSRIFETSDVSLLRQGAFLFYMLVTEREVSKLRRRYPPSSLRQRPAELPQGRARGCVALARVFNVGLGPTGNRLLLRP